MKKILVLALIAFLSMTFIFASGSSESAKDGVTTIKLASWDTTSSPYVSAVVEAFEAANPDIKVEIIDTPSTDYITKLNVMLNGGSDLDVFFIKEGDKTKEFYDKGQLAELSSYVAASKFDLSSFNGIDETYLFDGKLYAMPVRMDFYILFYNKDIFDAAGEPYPSNDMTWAEFEDTARRITSGSGANKKYGAFIHTWQACVQNWAVQDGVHTIMDGEYSFFKPYYELFLRMQKEGTIMDYATLKTSNIHYSTPFLQGNVGMLPMGTWFMATIIDRKNNGESDVNWGVSVIPHADNIPAGYTVGSATPIAINNASKNKDAAWRFVSFVSGPEGQSIYARFGQIPASANEDIIAEIVALDGMPEGTAEALKTVRVSPDRPSMDYVGPVNQMLGEVHSLIMLEEVTIDEGLAEMAERFVEVTRD